MKRKVITLGRIIRNGMGSFARNVTLAIAAMAVMVVTLTIVLFSVVTSATLNHSINQLTDKINISIYLNDNVTAQQRDHLMNELQKLPEVKGVSYISKDEALAIYKTANANNQSVLTALNETDSNPLPASIEVDPVDPAKIDQIQRLLKRPETVQLEDKQAGTSYKGSQKEAIDSIARATSILKRVGIIAVAIFAVVSMLIIFNTIQMAIFNRRDEITIMRLLGASTSYIRGPFVVESIIYGILSALISILVMDVLFLVSASALRASSLGLLDISYASGYFYQHFYILLTLQLAAGIVIGAVSSIVATRRYLKFKTR